MNTIRQLVAVLAAAVLLWVSPVKAQGAAGTYTQTAPVICRSGELNCFSIGLKDSSGTLRGSYTLECNSNAINNFTCHFTLDLDGITYYGKVTQVTTYFPRPPYGSGSYAYNWSASGDGTILTGSSPGQGKWGGCGLGKGYCAYIDSSTVTVQ